MAQFTIEIPDEHVELVINSLCGHYDYDPETTGLSPAQFANQQVRQYIKDVVVAYAVKQAETTLEDARNNAEVTIIDPLSP